MGLAGEGVIKHKATVFWLEGGVEAGFVSNGDLIDYLQVVRNKLFVLLEVGNLLLQEGGKIVILFLLLLKVLQLDPHLKVPLL